MPLADLQMLMSLAPEEPNVEEGVGTLVPERVGTGGQVDGDVVDV